MNVDLVFEGGGVLGISFIGAYQALTDHDFVIKRCAGTSAGSIISTLIIAGYTSEEIINILNKTDFKLFLKKTKLSKVFLLGKPLSILLNEGIYNGDIIRLWMEQLLRNKGVSTFKDVMEHGESKLKIIAADITRRKMMILPDDLIFYGIKPEDFSIAQAVRMSCSIPFFYTPVKLDYLKKTSYFVDGALLSSYPIWIFDLKGKPVRPTIGLKIKDTCSLTSQGKNNVYAFTRDLIDAPINKDEMSLVRDKDLVRTIIIDNYDQVKATNFKLSKEEIDYLYTLGYGSVDKFLKKWNFSEYIKQFM